MSTAAVSQFLAAVAGRADADMVAAAVAAHLAAITVKALPAAAQPHWRDLARLLKSPPDKPLPEKSIAAICSWPAARVDEFLTHIRQTRDILEKLENERLEDEIRDNIRRHYL